MFHRIFKKLSDLGPRTKTALEAVFLFCVIVLSILAITWPWGSYIDHAFISHWDPPLHAWKVIGIAKAILAGHILPAGTNMNVYYPHPGSLYFESLYWPQAVVAALCLKFTANPVLSFHLSYLFFWALSGVCFWFFLREVGVSRLLTYIGAIFFTIMPYRMSYLVEFNMQMCFGVPLVLLFVARYFRKPNICNALLAALFLCLQAISELYQAVFLFLALPFFIMPLLSHRWRLFRSSKKFWIPVAVAGCVALVFVAVYMWPYLLCIGNSLTRSLRESDIHRLEPFSYLATYKHTAWRMLPRLATKESEMCAYVTFPVLLLTGLFLAYAMRFRLSKVNRDENPAAFVMRVVRAVLLLLFFAISIVNYNNHGLCIPFFYSRLPVGIVALSLLIPFFTVYHSDRERVLDGLLNVAIFAFFMSLGPYIQCGNACPHVSNHLYKGLYKMSGMLQGFRVVSRFSLLVLIFDIVASCVIYTKLIEYFGKRTKHGKIVLEWALVPMMALVVLESIPRKRVPNPVTISHSPVLQHLDERKDPYVLAIVPFGRRGVDAMDMFEIGEEKRLLVWAWGGTFPAFTQKLRVKFKNLEEEPDSFKDHLNTLWPECYILLHRGHLETLFTPETRKMIIDRLLSISDKIDDDNEQLALLKLHPSAPSATVIKLIRHDFMQSRSSMRFHAELPQGTSSNQTQTVSVELNDKEFDTFEISPGKKDFVISYPKEQISITVPNTIRFTADQPISITDFSLIP